MTKEIQMTSVRFTKNDMAKYPFLKENTEHIRKLDLKIEDLASAELSAALERAEERLEESILYAIVDRKTRNEEIARAVVVSRGGVTRIPDELVEAIWCTVMSERFQKILSLSNPEKLEYANPASDICIFCANRECKYVQ